MKILGSPRKSKPCSLESGRGAIVSRDLVSSGCVRTQILQGHVTVWCQKAGPAVVQWRSAQDAQGQNLTSHTHQLLRGHVRQPKHHQVTVTIYAVSSRPIHVREGKGSWGGSFIRSLNFKLIAFTSKRRYLSYYLLLAMFSFAPTTHTPITNARKEFDN